ncbi:MAG: sugar phosphate isomerase/epimerase family protein [Patescibacteria group bacterium]
MKIALSNIAWDPAENEAVAGIMKEYNVTSLEVAPTKLWNTPENATDADIQLSKEWWEKRGIQIVSGQSLLYGHPELELFVSEENRNQTFEYLSKIIQVCGKLGAKALVFGSPKNRQLHKLTPHEGMEIAVDFFHRLGQVAQDAGTCVVLEPNPPHYFCDFIQTAAEGVELVKQVNHAGFRLHLDAAAMTLNEEPYAKTIEASFPWLKHFHASEPNLQLLGSGKTDHPQIAAVLKSLGYEGFVSVEMKGGLLTPNTKAVETALHVITNIYG